MSDDAKTVEVKQADKVVLTDERPGFFKRWGLRLGKTLLAAVLLLGLGLLVVQIVLWSALPRGIVQSAITGATGLPAELDGLSVSLLGAVNVEGVRIYLPGDGEPLAVVDELSAQLNPLPIAGWEVLTGKPTIRSVSINGVTIHAREEDGVWNVLTALEQIQAAGGKSAPSASTPSSGPIPVNLPLPTVDVTGVRVNVTRNGDTHTLGDLTFRGETVAPLLYKFGFGNNSANGTVLSGEGSIIPAAAFGHEVRITVAKGFAEWVGPIAPVPPVTVEQLVWKGTAANGLDGKLTIQHAAAEGLADVATGEIDITAGSGDGPLVEAIINNLKADVIAGNVGLTKVISGRVVVTPENVVEVHNLAAELLEGRAVLELGRFDTTDLTGSVEGFAENLVYQGVQVEGNLTGTAEQSDINGFQLDIDGNFTGTDPTGRRFGGTATVDAAGPTYEQLVWDARLTESVYGAEGDVRSLPSAVLAAESIFNDNVQRVELIKLAVDDGELLQVKGVADWTPEVDKWEISAEVPGVVVNLPSTLKPYNAADFSGRTTLSGTLSVVTDLGHEVNVDVFTAHFGGLVFDLTGAIYPGGKPTPEATGDQPQQMAESATQPATQPTPGAGGMLAFLQTLPAEFEGSVRLDDTAAARQLFQGDSDDFLATVTINGDFRALDFELKGEATGQNMAIAGQPIEDFSGKLVADVTRRALRIETSDVNLFGGTAGFEARLPFDATPIKARLLGDDLNVATLAAIAGYPVQGRAGIDLTATAAGLSLDALQVSGDINLNGENGIRFADATLADTIDVGVALDGSTVRIEPVTLTLDDDTLSATAGFDLTALDTFAASVSTEGYPVKVDALDDAADVRIVRLDVPGVTLTLGDEGPSAVGQIGFGATVSRPGDAPGAPLTAVSLDTTLLGRAVALDTLELSILDAGTIYGERGYLEFDKPLQGRLVLRGTDLDPAPVLRNVLPDADPADYVSGGLDFFLELRPDDTDRPLGNFLIDFDLVASEPETLFIRNVPVDGLTSNLSLVLNEEMIKAGELDLKVFEKLVSRKVRIEMAGGVINGFTRLSQKELPAAENRPPELVWTAMLNLDIGDDPNETGEASIRPLDLKKLARAAEIDPEDLDPIGQVDGKIGIRGPIRFSDLMDGDEEALKLLSGDGRFNLSLLQLRGETGDKLSFTLDRTPNGYGTVGFALSDLTFRARDIAVFVNGAEVRGTLLAENLTLGNNALLDGRLVALPRPLKDSNVPVIGDSADEFFTAILAGSGATFFNIGGTIAEPRLSAATLDDLGGDIGKILGGG
jgi:hypothetical protein